MQQCNFINRGLRGISRTLEMNSVKNKVSNLLSRASSNPHCHQQVRGIRVKVYDGKVEQALSVMQRIMQSSGIERLINAQQTRHLKNSEKRVLAKKNLERRLRTQDYCRKLQAVLMKKVRYISTPNCI